MSMRALWVVVALFLDWWAGGLGKREFLRMLAVGGLAVLGGAGVGCWLGAGLPPAGAALLGAGILGCLGLVHLAEAGGTVPAGATANYGLLVRSLLAAVGMALMGLNPAQTVATLLVGMLGGIGASLLRVRTTAPHWWRGPRLLAGLLLLALCLVTFRGGT